jgi:hypothetical protein
MSEIEKAENEEILKLLILIKGFLERHQDGDTPVRFAYVNKYIEKYSSSKKLKITQGVLSDLHDPKNEFTDSKSTVRVYMNNNFKPFLKKFFETEGKSLPYELSIPDGTYNALQLKRRAKGGIVYTERLYLRMKYRPFIFHAIASTLMFFVPLILLSSVIIVFAESNRNNPKAILLGFLIAAITLFAMPIVFALSRLSYKKFVAFHLNEFFLKLSGREVVLASYSAGCPICKNELGVVKVVFSWMRGKGYLGKCQENPDGHIFSFDHTSLTGERL